MTLVTVKSSSAIPTEGREKQSLQLVNVEIATPAATYIQLNTTCWRDRKDGKIVDDFLAFVIL